MLDKQEISLSSHLQFLLHQGEFEYRAQNKMSHQIRVTSIEILKYRPRDRPAQPRLGAGELARHAAIGRAGSKRLKLIDQKA